MNPESFESTATTATTSETVATPPFSRYRRRSSVTRYSLDDSNNDNNLAKDQPCYEESSSPEETTTTIPHKRYGRRGSVTRFSLHTAAAATSPKLPETRSLSPVPIARRGSVTTYTAVVVVATEPSPEESQPSSPEEHSPESEPEPQVTLPQEEVQEPPRVRYGRRCSITKYSLDAAHVVAKSTVERVTEPRVQRRCSVTKYSLVTTPTTEQPQVSLTVEEPIDTIDSIEHQQMLANDTIESSGAGDLLMGWRHHSPTTIKPSSSSKSSDNAGQLICGFGTRKQRQQQQHKQQGKSSYFFAVISKKLSMTTPIWVKTNLRSEVPIV